MVLPTISTEGYSIYYALRKCASIIGKRKKENLI